MFRIKICGITRAADAMAAAEAGADAIGLNFFPGSRRFITRSVAAEVLQAIPRSVVRVGVFVNATVAEVCRAHDELELDLIQLHGDEPPDFIPQLDGRLVMKAFRLGPSGLVPVAAYLEACDDLGVMPTMLLIDSFQQASYGGTGVACDWSAAAKYWELPIAQPLVLAGGLTPANIRQAIQAVRPIAVDTASGVETAPGIKDRDLIGRFTSAARQAFDER